jgi:hypothetical protein
MPSGAIIVHNHFTIPLTNLSGIMKTEGGLELIFIFKHPLAERNGEIVSSLGLESTIPIINDLYEAYTNLINKGGYSNTYVDGKKYDDLDISGAGVSPNLRPGILIINNIITISISNIGLIHIANINLNIYLKHPMTVNNVSKTIFTLFFENKNKREQFHKRLVEAIGNGSVVNYNLDNDIFKQQFIF